MVDSDGDIGSITPLWLDAGIDILGPYEVAAGMDVTEIGRRHPGLIMTGGIDKIQLARGPAAIRAEVDRRVRPLLDRGGYIPSLDHSTIPELTLVDYRYYREYLLSVTEA
jgi:uroporphyrinogen decarboxylase